MNLTEKELILEYVGRTYDNIKALKLTDEIVIKFRMGNFILAKDTISREINDLRSIVERR